jgi:hypothetical protein
LNSRTLPQFHFLETLDSCKEKIALEKPKFFTVLDQKCGYYSLRLDPESIPLTAFSVGSRRYEYTRVLFGLRNAPSWFVKNLVELLEPDKCDQLLVYVDDLCVFTSTLDKHFRILQTVFDKYRSANLRINPKKSQFACSSVRYLGMRFSKDGMSIDKDRYALISNWPKIQNVKQLKSWLGLVSYFRCFIKNHSIITAPLRKLLLKDTPFVWGPEHQEAVDKLKQILVSGGSSRLPQPHITVHN